MILNHELTAKKNDFQSVLYNFIFDNNIFLRQMNKFKHSYKCYDELKSYIVYEVNVSLYTTDYVQCVLLIVVFVH